MPKSINKWFVKYQSDVKDYIGLLSNYPPDFQNQARVFIKIDQMARGGAIRIITQNLIPISIYLSVRHCIDANWLNDRDQFLYPNDGWQTDTEFHNDCLAFTLFHSQNRISNSEGTNHWIPFTEQEVNAQSRFESHFMTDFINGKIKTESENDLFGKDATQSKKREFSEAAKDVFDAGRELWKYYHSQPNVNVNASLYDIREYFQGRNEKGRMNSRSDDEKYMELIGELRDKLNILAAKIKPKIYEYGFLKE